ncbi:MAG TPA: hypothetical protein VF553_20840 [Pyrinomonadaceae bacterium]|jgi:hypothetical protein
MSEDEGLVPTQRIDDIALRSAVTLWAETTTDGSSDRSHDLRRDKVMVVLSFFGFVAKHPAEIMPGDVQRWRDELESRGLKQNTVYARVSRLSSFYRWLMKDPVLSPYVTTNPALLARPKRPKPYQSGSTKSLTDEEMNRLLASVKARADAGSMTAKRDYALLLPNKQCYVVFHRHTRRGSVWVVRSTRFSSQSKSTTLLQRR